MGLIASSSSLAVEDQNGLESTTYHSFVQPSIRRFYKVFEKKFVSSSGDLSDRSMCFIPHQGLFMRLSFSILLLMASFWWICRYGGYNGKLASHISLSQRPDPKEKQVISLDQDVQVCGYFWWMMDENSFI